MKKMIMKFLGLDKIQQENEYMMNKIDNMSTDLYDRDWQEIAGDAIDYFKLSSNIDNDDLAESLDYGAIARDLDLDSLSDYIDAGDVAELVDIHDIARNIDADDVASCFSADDIAECFVLEEILHGSNINIDNLAEQVAERVTELWSDIGTDDSPNTPGSGVTTDAVESMIHLAIQQFSDSLEVEVNAKLNYNI